MRRSSELNALLQCTDESAAVLGMITLPHESKLPETHRTKQQHMHRQSYLFFPACGLLLVITSIYLH